MLLIGARKRTVKHYLLEFRKEVLLSVARTLKDNWLVFLLKKMADSKINYLTSYLTYSVFNLLTQNPRFSVSCEQKRHALYLVCAAYPGK